MSEILCTKFGHGTWNDASHWCECDRWWSGKTDMLNYDGHACPTSEIANLVIWTIPLIGILLLQVRIVKAFRVQIPTFFASRNRLAKRGIKLRWWQHKPLQLCMIAQISPLTIAPGLVLKLAQHENRVVGYDPIPSLGFFIGAAIQFAGNIMAEQVALGALMQGIGGSKVDSVKASQTRMFRGAYAALFMYCAGSLPAFLGGVIMDRPIPNPEESMMRYLLVVRNMCVISYLASMAVMARQTTKHTARLMEEQSSNRKSEKAREMQLILGFMRKNAKEKVKTAISAAIIYVTFSIKPLWPYEGYPIAFLLFKVAGSRAHFICNYSNSSKRSAAPSTAYEVHPTMNNSSVALPDSVPGIATKAFAADSVTSPQPPAADEQSK